MRHEAYSQRRHEMMALVRTDRKKIVNAEMKAGMATSGGGQGEPGLTPGAMMAAQAKANASYVEKEEKRLLKMKRRQEKEIQQMVEFEVKMSTIAADREQKAEQETQRVRLHLIVPQLHAFPSKTHHHRKDLSRWPAVELAYVTSMIE